MSTLTITRKNNIASIASDSMYSIGSLSVNSQYKVNSHKIYAVNDCYVGLVGWCALDNVFESLIDEHSKLLDFSSKKSIFNTLRSIQALLVEEYHLNTTEDSDQPVDSSQMDGLVISKHGIFGFSSYRHVTEYSQFWAMGSGRNYALGAMHATYNEMENAEKIAQSGIMASCDFDDASGLPVQVKSIKLNV